MTQLDTVVPGILPKGKRKRKKEKKKRKSSRKRHQDEIIQDENKRAN